MNSINTQKNIIFGGGIAGLSIAFHLVRCGHSVVLIDRGEVGGEASSKAAGMITPASEVHLGEMQLMACFLTATAYYENFVAFLTSNQPEKIDYRKTGSLLCAIDNDGTRELARLFAFQKEMGLDVEEIDKTELSELEPLLSPRVTHAVYARSEACVDNIKLIVALKEYLLDSGRCQILERKIVKIDLTGDKIASVVVGLENKKISADQYFLATGLKHDIVALNDVFKIPQRPVKGQILTVQSTPDTIARPVRVHHRYPVYLVPRADGRIVIGATSEEQSDTNVTAGGMMDLLQAAWQILPQIYDAPVVTHQAGLRPATPDHKPIFGTTPLANLAVLTGLYRHGIMVAPLLARDLVDFILTGQNPWKEFSMNRFSLSS